MEVQFFEEARDRDLKFAVVAVRYENQWLLCRRKDRETWAFPGGHREEGETIHAAARRVLWEETGAREYQLEPVTAFCLTCEGEHSWGGLFFAELWELGVRPAEFEIGENGLFGALPPDLAYPELTPAFMASVTAWLDGGHFRSAAEDIFELML